MSSDCTCERANRGTPCESIEKIDPACPEHGDDRPGRTIMARLATWSLDEVRILDYLVSLGRPIDVLRGQREAVMRGAGASAIGGANPVPNTTDADWVRSGLLDVYRAACRAIGIKVLPAPGSVHDSVNELDKV